LVSFSTSALESQVVLFLYSLFHHPTLPVLNCHFKPAGFSVLLCRINAGEQWQFKRVSLKEASKFREQNWRVSLVFLCIIVYKKKEERTLYLIAEINQPELNL